MTGLFLLYLNADTGGEGEPVATKVPDAFLVPEIGDAAVEVNG